MLLLSLLLRAASAQAPEAPAPDAPAAPEAPVPDAPAPPEAPAPAAAPEAYAEAPAADAFAAGPPDASRLAIDPAELLGPPAGPPLSGDALREQTHVVAKLLRCPVCQGLSVADSPSESALAMKAEVQDLVARGYDTEQVILYFEASYGEFIRLEPKFEGVNVFVWAAPVLLIVGGGAWVLLFASASGRRAKRDLSPAPTPGGPLSLAKPDAEMAEYLRRVREESR